MGNLTGTEGLSRCYTFEKKERQAQIKAKGKGVCVCVCNKGQHSY